MATERLELKDSYLRRFTARVLAVRDEGGRRAVVLDRSAFYPEGGGQPGDRGTLGGAAVADTQERAGEVLHLLAPGATPPAEGAEVECELDWARRFDHLQQHHGQHLLSAAFERTADARTVSFHLGERTCTIDLDCPLARLDAAALRAAEAAANASVWANHPVIARDFGPEERARLPLRKEPVKGDRVVLVEGVDASPCGGTHPRSTGEVGAIAVLRAQRWGQGQARVEFACGGRALRLLAEAGGLLAQAAEALGCGQAEVGAAAARVAQESLARRKALEAAERELARFEASRLALAQPGGAVVARLERGAAFARSVAQALSGQGRVALVGAVEDGRAHLCFSRPKGPGPALNALLKEALALLGGKGGGSPEHATGSGDPARLDEALAGAARTIGAV